MTNEQLQSITTNWCSFQREMNVLLEKYYAQSAHAQGFLDACIFFNGETKDEPEYVRKFKLKTHQEARISLNVVMATMTELKKEMDNLRERYKINSLFEKIK